VRVGNFKDMRRCSSMYFAEEEGGALHGPCD
jgi:hypothetical protein